MNPHQKNKIDVSSLSPEEQKLFRLYGKLPNKKDLLQNKLKERKYFDSGDYALSKAGKASDVGVTTIGSQHPSPENIPHLSASPTNGNGIPTPGSAPGSTPQLGTNIPGLNAGNQSTPIGRSPNKESSFLNRETSIDDEDGDMGDSGFGSMPQKEGIPIMK